jgi:hypothetical protein
MPARPFTTQVLGGVLLPPRPPTSNSVRPSAHLEKEASCPGRRCGFLRAVERSAALPGGELKAVLPACAKQNSWLHRSDRARSRGGVRRAIRARLPHDRLRPSRRRGEHEHRGRRRRVIERRLLARVDLRRQRYGIVGKLLECLRQRVIDRRGVLVFVDRERRQRRGRGATRRWRPDQRRGGARRCGCARAHRRLRGHVLPGGDGGVLRDVRRRQRRCDVHRHRGMPERRAPLLERRELPDRRYLLPHVRRRRRGRRGCRRRRRHLDLPRDVRRWRRRRWRWRWGSWRWRCPVHHQCRMRHRPALPNDAPRPLRLPPLRACFRLRTPGPGAPRFRALARAPSRSRED